MVWSGSAFPSFSSALSRQCGSLVSTATNRRPTLEAETPPLFPVESRRERRTAKTNAGVDRLDGRFDALTVPTVDGTRHQIREADCRSDGGLRAILSTLRCLRASRCDEGSLLTALEARHPQLQDPKSGHTGSLHFPTVTRPDPHRLRENEVKAIPAALGEFPPRPRSSATLRPSSARCRPVLPDPGSRPRGGCLRG